MAYVLDPFNLVRTSYTPMVRRETLMSCLQRKYNTNERGLTLTASHPFLRTNSDTLNDVGPLNGNLCRCMRQRFNVRGTDRMARRLIYDKIGWHHS